MAAENKKPQAQITRWSFGSGNTFMWLGLTLLVLGWFSQNGNGGGQSALPKQPPICSDAKSVQLQPSVLATQNVRPDCLSGLIFTNDPSKYKANFKGYGSVDICFWDKDHCSGWERLIVDNMVQTNEKKLPKYSAFRLIGDSGTVEVRLYKK